MGADGPTGRPGPRAWWRVIEPVHAVTYFAPESRQSLRATGLRGFWTGYFAARVAPVGAVGPSTVASTFFNFHPSMVERSIPAAWDFADPTTVLTARRTGAAQALRRLDPTVEDRSHRMVPLVQRVGAAAEGAGRVLFGANRALGMPEDPVEALWQACTTLREHRGDGHVAALTAAGLSACQALVLFALSEDLPVSMFLDSRGWSADEWEASRAGLEARGLVQGDRLTPEGVGLRRWIEETTDVLAAPAFDALGQDEGAELFGELAALARAVDSGGEIPYPNPMGLPPPGPG